MTGSGVEWEREAPATVRVCRMTACPQSGDSGKGTKLSRVGLYFVERLVVVDKGWGWSGERKRGILIPRFLVAFVCLSTW